MLLPNLQGREKFSQQLIGTAEKNIVDRGSMHWAFLITA